MKKRFVSLFLAFLVVACGPQAPKPPPEFPLYKGTSWVYTYQTYEQSGTGGVSVLKAIYQLTETVLDTEAAAPYFIAHVKRAWKLLNADAGLSDDMASSQNAETW